MKKTWLSVLLPVLISGQALSQKFHTSLYFSPLQPVIFPLPNYRFSIEQSFSQKLALFADYSFYTRYPKAFYLMDGKRGDLGLKYFYKSGLEQSGNYKNLFWMSASYGYESQTLFADAFDREKNKMTSEVMFREVQHFLLGSGVSIVYKNWSLDLGLRVGVKKRDVDVSGYSEISDDQLEVKGSQLIQRTLSTKEQYLPDFVLLFRFGYSLFYF